MTTRDINREIADLSGAIKVIEDFCKSPLDALTEANAKKSLPNRPFQRSEAEINSQLSRADTKDIEAISCLSDRLDSINQQLVANMKSVNRTSSDTAILWSPIDRVGIYVPQRLPATAYTFLSASRAAGVRDFVLYAAQNDQGNLDPLVLWCARKYKATIIGGPARFGFPALAFGIPEESLACCPLVCGPCGRALNVIKQTACLLAGVTSDMSAGPSDLAILADASADWHQIALDIVSQLEHGPDSSAEMVLVGDDAMNQFQKLVLAKVDQNLRIRIKVSQYQTISEGIAVVNQIAPETAEVWVDNDHITEKLTTSGVVYERMGSSLGDYGAIGRGCADPTGKQARAQSGLSPMTFMRTTAIVSSSNVDQKYRAAATRISHYEQLPMHQRAIIGPTGIVR